MVRVYALQINLIGIVGRRRLNVGIKYFLGNQKEGKKRIIIRLPLPMFELTKKQERKFGFG